MKNILIILLMAFGLQSCSNIGLFSAKTDGIKETKNELEYLIKDANVANAFIGIYVERLSDGKVIYRQNEHKLLVPASNLKLYTTAAGTALLGSDFRYQTFIATDSSFSDSILYGNLVVHGSGDPTISGRFHDGEILTDFQNWADSLKEMGIKTIKGNLIADNSYFKQDILGDGWNWDDEPYWYSAQPSALTYNDNCVDFTITPSEKVGEPVIVEQNPDINYLNVFNTATTSQADSAKNLSIKRERARNLALISGSYPKNKKAEKESISVENPALFYIETLRSVLQENGITIEGENKVCNKSVKSTDTLFVHQSPELAEIVKVINKKSHNLYAEQLLKTLGAKFNEEGSFNSGADVVTNWGYSIGIPPSEIIMVDGSGLSRKNFVSPYATATLLKHMYHHPEFESYYDSLPIAGVDGTIKSRMKNTPAQGNVRAKTGFVRHMRTLSGFVENKNGQMYVFSLMMNNYSVPTSYINELQNKICVLLSNLTE